MSMQDIFKKLAEPFDESDIEWRVGNTNQKAVARQTGNNSAKPTKGMMLPYVTNRAIMNRLDTVVGPENWTNEYRQHHVGTICRLGICINGTWVWKEDGADNTHIEPTKGGLSDAMKRSAVQFGIGRYLYDAESPWVDLDEYCRPKTQPMLKIKKSPENGKEDWVADATKKIEACATLDELKAVWESLPASVKAEVEDAKEIKKQSLS